MDITSRQNACNAEQAECSQPLQIKRRYVAPFWYKVRRGSREECWPWLGYKRKSGHGLTRHENVMMNASRKAWILEYGWVPKGLCVNHRCDNPLCCNVDHMYLGTRAQNMADRFGTDGVTLVTRRRATAGIGQGRHPWIDYVKAA